MSWKSFLFIFIFLCSICNAQTSIALPDDGSEKDSTSTYKEVEILHADKLEFKTLENGYQLRKLVGEVSLKHENTIMNCDSAYIYKETNLVHAWGNIHINDSDSINAYSDALIYDGKIKKAELIDNARIEDGDKTLTSDTLYYDMENKKGYYNTNGKLVSDSTILVSKRGVYFTQTKTAEFRYDVVITAPNYKLVSDSLHYNTKTKVARFYGPTTIYNDSSTIDCILGSYDTEREIATFGKGTVINNAPQVLKADSLYYERFRGYGKAFYYFDWVDTEIEAGMKGNLAEYFENNQEIIAYNRPLLKVKQEEDTLFMKGDIIHTKENDSTGKKEFWSFDNVRLFKEDIQGVADSLFYSFSDTLMRMYYNPILWNDANQMLGDTILLQQANDQIETAIFKTNAFISMQSEGKLFDQVKGKTITAYFENNEMQRMNAVKNAESLYFGKNDAGAYIGGNLVFSARLIIYMEEKEIDHITFIDQPDALFTPISKMPPVDLYLKGFTWFSEIRPKDKNDL